VILAPIRAAPAGPIGGGARAALGISTPWTADSVFLGRVNPRDGAPAIEHAYAATIYQAQGATLDSAFVMTDPSMKREEFYVAASRTRGETFIYATPEVQLAREEIAPDSPYLRDGLEHIAEAAERIGAQSAAHDEALRSQFAHMPTDELARRVHELRSEAAAEQHNESRHLRAEETISREAERVESFRSRSGVHPSNEESALQRIEAARAERDQLPAVGHDARAKAAVAEHVLSERERAAATAARLSPPAYIKSELGEAERSDEGGGVGPGGARDRELPRQKRRGGQTQCPRAEAQGPGRAGSAEAGQGAAAAYAASARAEETADGRAFDAPRDRAMSQRMGERPSHGSLTEPLLNADEAAQLLHVPRSTLYELVRSRHLPHVRVGRGLRFTREDLGRWVSDNTYG
jgi:excisionase family DNA binding protein